MNGAGNRVIHDIGRSGAPFLTFPTFSTADALCLVDFPGTDFFLVGYDNNQVGLRNIQNSLFEFNLVTSQA